MNENSTDTAQIKNDNGSLNKLVDLAQQGSVTFQKSLQSIFGQDIPELAFEQLRQDILQGNFKIAPIEVDASLPMGTAAFDQSQEKILLSPEVANLGEQNPDNSMFQRTISEEMGHQIDRLLRNQYSNVGGDALLDEGARFAKEIGGFQVSEADIAQDTKVGDLEFHNEAGHYFTTLKVAQTLGFNDNDAKTLAMWSQLPDEVGAYDATILQIEKVSNFIFNPEAKDDNGTVLGESIKEHRDNVQKMIHSFGNDPEEIRGKLQQFIRENKNNLPLVGIAIHAYGDTYAHTVLGTEGTANAHSYGHGFGHLLDVHAPDEIHRRVELWETYVNDITQVLGTEVQESDQATLDKIKKNDTKEWTSDMIERIDQIVKNNTHNTVTFGGNSLHRMEYIDHDKIASDTITAFRQNVDPKGHSTQQIKF